MKLRANGAFLCAIGLTVLAVILSGCAGGSGGSGGAPPPGGGGAGGAASPAPGATPAPAPVILAGAARVDITPPVGAPLGGYGGGPRRPLDAVTIPLNLAAALGFNVKFNPAALNTLFTPSTAVHDPICAKALVLERDGVRYAILSLDLIGVSRRARDDIAARVAAFGVAPERLLVAATHTHSGPGALGDKRFWELAAMDLFDARVYGPLVDRYAQAVGDAVARLGPARVGIASAPVTSVQRNRRGLGVVDPDLTTILVQREDGTPVALAVNLAIHGISLDADNLEYSADLMGYCEREVEAQLGGGAVCLYLNGAEGDVSPNAYGFPGAESVGRAIAVEALRIAGAAAATASGDVPLAASFEEFRFPHPPAIRFDKLQGSLPPQVPQLNLGILQQVFNALYVELDETWFNRRIPVQAMRIGDACLVAVPGEPLTAVGLALKADARVRGFAHPVVVGLANDHLGYVADAVEYDRGGYEALLTLFGRDEAALLSDALARQVDRIKP